MTAQMIIALVIVILMIVMIMSDKFSFGAPPLFACALLVLTSVSKIEEAFAGFTDRNVIMVAGFMAIMAALQKTSLMAKIKASMANLAAKGGYKSYVLLLLVVMLASSLTSGSTGYYVMVLTVISTIPYNQHLPNSKLMLPLGFATGRALIPVGVAFWMGMTSSLLEKAGSDVAGVTLPKYAMMVFVMSLGFMLWSLFSYRFLPDHDITGGEKASAEGPDKFVSTLTKNQENLTYATFIISVVVMMFADKIGQAAYVIPGIGTAFLCLIGVFNFTEVRNNLFSPLILMMASVIGVANALGNTGFTGMVGEAVANALGENVNVFVLTLMFCLLTSASATLTGASIGSLFVFAPIAIATCMSLGIDPTGPAAAMTVSAWGGGFLPIDGLPALILGMGKYKLKDFLKFAVPMYLIQILFLAIGAMIAFPR